MRKSPKNNSLTIAETREASRLTRKLTVFDSFQSLLAFYRGLSGGYRAVNCRLNLLPHWTPAERAMEMAEHKLQLALAHLVDRAEGRVGRRERHIVSSPVSLTKRAA